MATFLIFGGAFGALQAERTLRQQGLSASLAPAPPGTAGPCGTAVRIADGDHLLARSVLERHGQRVLQVLVRPM